MARSIPYEQRTNLDKVFPGGFLRIQLDRKISIINELFAGAFGIEESPLQASVDWVRAAGSVALLDVGCGTSNTLRTWRRTVSKLAPCDPGQVKATGISKRDYSRESRYWQTEEACRNGSVEYLLGDAVEILRQRANGSANVVLSFNTFEHIRRPYPVLREMVRVTSPGGVLFFNIVAEQNMSDEPMIEYINQLQDNGYTTRIKPTEVTVVNELGQMGTTSYVFCLMHIPNE